MWHPEILNQQLDKIVKRVVICQKIVRGFLCRRRLLHLLTLAQKQSIERIAFVSQIHKHGSQALEKQLQIKSKIKVIKRIINKFFFVLLDFFLIALYHNVS
jgi:hypothetical protein